MNEERIRNRIQEHLSALYGKDAGKEAWEQLEARLDDYGADSAGSPLDTLKELNVLLITYADQFQKPGQPHITSLAAFIRNYLEEHISAVHLLPFYPYSSDDGFSVIDYKAMDTEIGTWDDLQELTECCSLMFDAVINHISRESEWFQKYIRGQQPYADYFLEVDPGIDLSQVTRPRAYPLLTEVKTTSGQKFVWTTFSADQIDLNYSNPEVLLDILDVLLFYIKNGSRIIRLDAIAYLWKEIGTTCIHLPQTHRVIKLMRAVLDLVAPEVVLITETNVPHAENISYFGEQLRDKQGHYPLGDEAQMVYQFPLAPLVLHTLRTGDSSVLTSWAESLEIPFNSAAFLNFIASHDGIGVRPAEGLLTAAEIQGLVSQTLANGGEVSFKTNQDGSQSVYELNITLYDLINEPGSTPLELGVQRFMASQAIMLSLAGVPGIYIHSLFGTPNAHEEVERTGRVRSINRKKYLVGELEDQIAEQGSRAARVFKSYTHFLDVRKEHPAFKPLAPQQILNLDPRVFSLLRSAEDSPDQVLCIINITNSEIELTLDPSLLPTSPWTDLLSKKVFDPVQINLAPYQVVWLV